MIAVTGLGLSCPLGNDPATVFARLCAGEVAVRPHPALAHLPSDLAASVDGPDLKAWLKRKKDQKLMPRAAVLAIAAVGRLLESSALDREDLALFMGVGREPPDEGDSEPCLVASARDGQLDTALLATQGAPLYPPLLPLKSLPNMAMAHVAILFGLHGENDATTGEAGAGLLAVHEALHAVAEGRCRAALAGGADARVDFGTARDRYRVGRAGPGRPPGEGAVVLLLEPLELANPAQVVGTLAPGARGAVGGPSTRAHWPATGDLGTADALFELAMAIVSRTPCTVEGMDDEGGSVALHWTPAR